MPEKKAKRRAIPADLKGPKGKEAQPVSGVVWIARERIHANDYNPNRVFPPEMRLLKVSLLTDGWTQPIVVRPIFEMSPFEFSSERLDDAMRIEITQEVGLGFELVDGYHRWLAAEDKKIAAMTGGELPCTIMIPTAREHQQMSTIRHNRARGEHQVLDMSAIVVGLIERGLAEEEIMDLLQMERDEVARLRARGDMLERGSQDGFSQGWKAG